VKIRPTRARRAPAAQNLRPPCRFGTLFCRHGAFAKPNLTEPTLFEPVSGASNYYCSGEDDEEREGGN